MCCILQRYYLEAAKKSKAALQAYREKQKLRMQRVREKLKREKQLLEKQKKKLEKRTPSK